MRLVFLLFLLLVAAHLIHGAARGRPQKLRGKAVVPDITTYTALFINSLTGCINLLQISRERDTHALQHQEMAKAYVFHVTELVDHGLKLVSLINRLGSRGIQEMGLEPCFFMISRMVHTLMIAMYYAPVEGRLKMSEQSPNDATKRLHAYLFTVTHYVVTVPDVIPIVWDGVQIMQDKHGYTGTELIDLEEFRTVYSGYFADDVDSNAAVAYYMSQCKPYAGAWATGGAHPDVAEFPDELADKHFATGKSIKESTKISTVCLWMGGSDTQIENRFRRTRRAGSIVEALYDTYEPEESEVDEPDSDKS